MNIPVARQHGMTCDKMAMMTFAFGRNEFYWGEGIPHNVQHTK